MKEIPRNIPTGTGTFGLHSGQKGGKRPLSAAAGRQMEKPAGQWEWPAGRRDRRGNRSKPVAPGGDGSASAERNSRESGGKERPEGGNQSKPVAPGGGGSASAGRNSREADGKERPAGQPVETGGPGRRRVGVGGEELPRGRREGAAGAATGRGGGDRRGNQSKPVAPGGGGSASAERNSRESGGKERPEGGATSRDRQPREATGRRRRGGTPERPAGRSDRRGNRQRRAVPEGGGSAAGQRAPAKKTPRSGTPGCRRTSRLQHNTYDT